jgi:hypothetical protein
MVQIHPYVLIKLRSDPRLLESAAPSDRAQLRQLWQPSTVARMSDEEIEGQLSLLGVSYDRARFIEVARAHASAWAVADTWERDAHMIGTSARLCSTRSCGGSTDGGNPECRRISVRPPGRGIISSSAFPLGL